MTDPADYSREYTEHCEEVYHERINAERIRLRVAGRQMAADMVSLIDNQSRTSRDYVESMLEEIARIAPFYPNADRHDPCGVPEENVTHEPIARLGATIMPFGQYADNSFDDTPIEYLDWLCRSQEGLYKDLRAYLKHPELESRRGSA